MNLFAASATLALKRSLCLALAALWLCSLAACSNDEDDIEELAEEEQLSAEELYTNAHNMLSAGRYRIAATLFDDVERQHPYSEWAARSQIMAAYAYYQGQQYDDAIITMERFIDIYPAHESLDYAYYLIGLSYYEQISDVGRDQGNTRKAKKALQDVVRRFPRTDYARSAKLKLDLTEDHLAGKEMMVGRYYLQSKEYLAAANRFRAVIDNHSTTSHAPEALHRLVEVYLLLGVKDQATRYAAVLGHNFPEGAWYERSYALLEGRDIPEPKAPSSSWFGITELLSYE